MGDCTISESEVNTWMETQGLTNTICNLYGYSNAPITYQQSKYCPICGIYCPDSLAEKWGGFLSFVILVVYHQALWVEINKNRLLGFWQHSIIPPMAWNLCLADPRTIKIFNDKLHTSFVKHDIYQKIHYIHVRAGYPLQTHLSPALEKLNELITRLIHVAEKNSEGK